MSTTEESQSMEIVNEEGSTSLPKNDANDYSRFKDVDDSDDDEEKKNAESSSTDKEPSLPLHEALVVATDLKDSGNACVKNGDMADAKEKYEKALKLLSPHEEIVFKGACVADVSDASQSLFLSLYGNLSMVLLKAEEYKECRAYCDKVVAKDPAHVKCLFRRGCANHKLGELDDAKFDLEKVVELDTGNVTAKKELAAVVKSIKERKAKDKAAFSGMFSGKSMYDDREKEMQERLRKKKEEEEKEMDEYNRSKIERRNEGKEEQTFEEWKKEKEDIKKEEEKERKKQKEEQEKKEEEARKKLKPIASADDNLYKPKSNKKEKKEKVEIDEEDEKNLKDLRGYKKTSDGRTTSYFNNELDEETKSLIGNIAPKRIDSKSSLDGASPGSAGAVSRIDSTASTNSNSSSGAGGSVWNAAGTWEEKDMSADVKSRLTELCKAVCTDVAKIKDVKTIDGDAQIVIARGKTRHIYDYSIKLEFEVSITESVPKTDGEGDLEEKTSKFKGSFLFPEVSPISSYDCEVSFKKVLPTNMKATVESAAKELKSRVISAFKDFDAEYKTM